MKQRNHAFDLLCGICIVRMVSLHTMQKCGLGEEAWWKEVMQWSYFFMSFFFFKAGYFNKSVISQSSMAYVKDKAKRLFIPYLTAGTIGNIVFFCFVPFTVKRYGHHIEPITWDHIWSTSMFFGNPPVWFLFSFFMAYIGIHFLEKARHRLFLRQQTENSQSNPPQLLNHWSSLLYISFPVIGYVCYLHGNPLWMSLNNIFMGIFYFQLGRAWRQLLSSWSPERSIFLSIILICVFIVGNCIWHNASYTMSYNEFKGPFLATLVNSTAILCGLSGLLIATQMPRIPIINYIGEHSMVFFISHFPIIYYYKTVQICFGRSIYGRYDSALILFPAIFMICAWLVPFVESTPWLSGRWKK